MKKFKIFSYIFVFISVFLIGNTVKAEKCDPSNLVKVSGNSAATTDTMYYNYCPSGGSCNNADTKRISTRIYTVTKEVNGKKVEMKAICLDPEYHGPGDSSTANNQTYCIQDMGSATGNTAAFNNAMVYIYQNGAASGNGNLSGDEAWNATNIASRLLSYNYGFNKGDGSVQAADESGPVFINTMQLVNEGFYDDFIRTGDYEALKAKMGISGDITNRGDVTIDPRYNSTIVAENDGKVLQEALRLYKAALSSGSSGGSGGGTGSGGTGTGGTGSDFSKAKVQVGNCDMQVNGNSFTAKFTITVTGLSGLSENTKIGNPKLTMDSNSSLSMSVSEPQVSGNQIKFDVTITGNKDSKAEVSRREFTLSMDVNDQNSTLNTQVATSVSNGKLQRMLIFNDKDQAMPFQLKFKVNCGDQEEGDSCPPDMNFPLACDAGEGETEGYIHEPKKFKSCIIDKNDYIGLPFKTNYISSTNPYCAVYCKEDYDYVYPGRVYGIAAGYYFKLSDAKITGTRTCVTNDIKVKQFLKDMKAINESITEAHRRWKEAVEALARLYTIQVGCSDSHGSWPNTTYHSWNCTQEIVPTFTYSHSRIDGDGRMIPASSSYGNSSGGCAGCGACTPPTLRAALEAQRASSEAAYHSGVKQRQTMIEQYTACSTWIENVKHLFEPTVEYEYEEEMYDDMLEHQWKDTDLGEQIKLEFCEVTTNANSVNEAAESKVDQDNDYSCSGPVGSINKNRVITYPICSPSDSCIDYGSSNKVHNYGNIKHISVRAKLYTSPTVWYTKIPTGEMSTSGGFNKTQMVDNPEPNYSYFPVLITTSEGFHKFTFTTKDNGQYNQTDEVGRLDKIFAKYYGKVAMEYVCEYEVTGELCYYCPPVITGGDGTGGMSYFYRPISTNDVFPNSLTDANTTTIGKSGLTRARNIGINWRTDKGQNTQKEIETGTGNSTEEKEIDPEYIFTLNPSQMKKIRQYNNILEKRGYGYNDFNLKCNAQGLDCISYFLNEVISECIPGGLSIWDDDNSTNGCYTDLRINKNPSFPKWTGAVYPGQGPSWK